MKTFNLYLLVLSSLLYIHFRVSQIIGTIVFKNEENVLSVISNIILIVTISITLSIYIRYGL